MTGHPINHGEAQCRNVYTVFTKYSYSLRKKTPFKSALKFHDFLVHEKRKFYKHKHAAHYLDPWILIKFNILAVGILF